MSVNRAHNSSTDMFSNCCRQSRMSKVQSLLGWAAGSPKGPIQYVDLDYRVAGRANWAALINRLPSFACCTEDSALGLGYLPSKVLKFENLGSESLKVLAQSEMTIIQSRTIIHCTPLYYHNAPEDPPLDQLCRLAKYGNLVCSVFDIRCLFSSEGSPSSFAPSSYST